MAHAFFVTGDLEQGIAKATTYLKEQMGLDAGPDLLVFRYGLFSVDDARKVGELAYRTPVQGTEKAMVIAVERIFHEAQNALLKVFEEPPAGTTLILVFGSEGILLPTLRSRLTVLPETKIRTKQSETIGDAFITATKAGREKLIEKVLARSKSDKPEEKQQARADALRIVEAVFRAVADEREKGRVPHATLAEDLERFIPILHERSAPLKPILEHLLITTPPTLGRS